MKTYSWKLLPLLILCAFGMRGCASKIDPVKTKKTPEAEKRQVESTKIVEERLDLAAISFVGLDDGKAINLAEYFDDNDLKYALLVFGSKGCHACNEKNAKLRDGYLARFDVPVIGINTDPKNYRTQIQMFTKKNGFDFIKWSDPNGSAMVANFLPSGAFGVPLTVLLHRDGIVWRYSNKDVVELDELVARTAATLKAHGSDIINKARNLPGKIPTPPVVLSGSSRLFSGNLWQAGPRRFEGIKVRREDGDAVELADALSDGINIIQIVPGNCAGNCETQLIDQAEIEAACGNGCRAIVLTEQPHDQVCAGHDHVRTFVGGEEFRQVFSSLFNQKYEIEFDADNYVTKIPDVTGPITLAFNNRNELIFAKEGYVNREEVLRILNQKTDDQAASPLETPNRKFFWVQDGRETYAELSDILSEAEFTIIGTFERMCGSCMEELKHWSEPAGLLDLCENSNGKCQLRVLEVGVPESEQTLKDYYAMLLRGDAHWPGITKQGNRIPLLIDPAPMGEEFLGLERFFQGYLTAMFPEWEGLYGTVIYDREGKIRGAFKPNPENPQDEVSEAVKALIEVKK